MLLKFVTAARAEGSCVVLSDLLPAPVTLAIGQCAAGTSELNKSDNRRVELLVILGLPTSDTQTSVKKTNSQTGQLRVQLGVSN